MIGQKGRGSSSPQASLSAEVETRYFPNNSHPIAEIQFNIFHICGSCKLEFSNGDVGLRTEELLDIVFGATGNDDPNV